MTKAITHIPVDSSIGRKNFIEQQIGERIQYWTGKMLLIGMLAFPFIGISDYFVMKNHTLFYILRAVVTIFLLVLFLLNRRKVNEKYQISILTIGALGSAVICEIMILNYGGHTSPYYAGMCLIFIVIIGFVPYKNSISVILAIVIYLIYLVPIFIFDNITQPEIFISHNVFTICTIAVALTWRILSHKTMLNELNLQYDLIRDKIKLEQVVAVLNNSELSHKALFDNATDGIIITNQDGLIVEANDKACLLHGLESGGLKGKTIAQLEESNTVDIKKRAHDILSSNNLVYEVVHKKHDGTPINFEVSSKAITLGNNFFIQSFYRDVTDKKKLHERLLQSQKMDSIGILAGGIAHDFRNLITSVNGYLDMVSGDHWSKKKLKSRTKLIQDRLTGSSHIITKLLGFARNDLADRNAPMNINAIIADSVKMFEPVLTKIVGVTLLLDPDLPCVNGDSNQLENVFINILSNAKDAMSDGGEITVRTSSVVSDTGERQVVVEVRDTGCGIPKDIIKRIYEPFFSTKSPDRGYGLGLSMVYGAIKSMNGTISVESEVSKGTSFIITLPASSQKTVCSKKNDKRYFNGSGNVFLIDDDKAVLTTTADNLKVHGYKVMPSTDPLKALEIFKKKHNNIDIVVMDVVMPQMDGIQLSAHMKAINPDVPIVLMSAYTGYVTKKKSPDSIILNKPFEFIELLMTVKNTIKNSKNGNRETTL